MKQGTRTFGRIRSGRGWLGLELVAGVEGGEDLRLAGASAASAGRDRFTNASMLCEAKVADVALCDAARLGSSCLLRASRRGLCINAHLGGRRLHQHHAQSPRTGVALHCETELKTYLTCTEE